MRLRLADQNDAAALVEVYGPYVEGTVISFEAVVPDEAEMAGRIAATLPAHPWLVAVEGGRVLGYAYAHPFAARAAYRWSAETSVYVRSDCHRGGVGRRLYSTLLDLLGTQGYREAFAGITLPNEASVGLHESMGFRHAAQFERAGWKFGAWHDVGWWQRRLGGDGDAAPVEPVSVADLDLTAVLDENIRTV